MTEFPVKGGGSFWLLHFPSVCSMAAILSLDIGRVSDGWAAGYVVTWQKMGENGNRFQLTLAPAKLSVGNACEGLVSRF